MIIFNLIMFFNVKISLFFNFFDPFVYFFWFLVVNLFFIIFHFFCLLFFFPYFFCWGGLGYIFGCDLISYDLILLSLWICVLIILARESVFRLGYFSGFFVFVVIALTLQDRASPVIEQLIFFHDHALIIITTVFYTIIRIIQNRQTSRFILEGQIIETIWTIAPAIILVFIAIPSLRLLYLIDEIHNPVITLKTVGHQ